jgi:PAS domain S-box-containing protein
MEKDMKPRVLIIDDSLTVRMDLQEAFESIGFATSVSDTLGAARKELAARVFSLVILDVLLPDGDGVDLLREIKSTPSLASVPVLLLSTEAEVHDRVRGLKTGADEYVGKPYDRANLLARARQLVKLERQPAEAALRLLLIDDSLTFRNEFKVVLENAGYSVITAESGEEGLRTAVAARPDAVIVNGILPGGLDGAAVIRRLKDDITLRNTPCLLLTATESTGDELRTFEAGADAYVRKGVDTELILARIVALLRSLGPQITEPAVSGLLGPKKILTVDDSPTYLHELSEELHKEGYDVIPARSGKEALELLEVEQVDCILLDLLMPELSGQETCRIIKKTLAWRNVPLLILTAVEETKAMVEGINAGADDYITKSSDFQVLKARLRAQLRRKQFEDEYGAIRERLFQKEIEAARAKAAQEIAEARASFEPLLHNEAWLNNVVRVAHLGAWDWDLLKNAQSWSDEQFRILGLEPGTVEPSYDRFLQALHPEDRQRVAEAVKQALAGECRFQADCRFIWPNGEARHVVCQGEICRNEFDQPVRIIGTLLDVTERKRAEEELARRAEELARSNADLQQFAYVASHDLQEPLRMVASFTQLLAQRCAGKLGADADEFIGYAVDGAHRMQVLVNDLLEYSRVSTRGKEFSGVDCEKILETVMADLQKALEESGGRVTHDPLPTVQGDQTQIFRVLLNLLGNALKFHGSEPPRVHVSAQEVNGEWQFSVRDNGIGIDPEHSSRIFLLFQRLHTRQEYLGTGMGLAIAKKIVERHGGRIWVESQPGKGSTFYFSLPVKVVTHERELQRSAAH